MGFVKINVNGCFCCQHLETERERKRTTQIERIKICGFFLSNNYGKNNKNNNKTANLNQIRKNSAKH